MTDSYIYFDTSALQQGMWSGMSKAILSKMGVKKGIPRLIFILIQKTIP